MTGGLPLVVTRPDPGGAETVARAAALGLDAHHMPLFATRMLDWSPPDPAHFDALMLTSAAAVRQAGPGLAALAPLPVYAVGAASAAAARSAGLDVAATGPGDARGLLDLMASLRIRRILWLCGRDRSAFDTHGFQLTPVPIYAVEPVAPPPGWDALIAAPAVVMAYSRRAAARIADLASTARAHLTLVAISDGTAAAAGQGWAGVTVAPAPDDAAMLAEAYALCHKGG